MEVRSSCYTPRTGPSDTLDLSAYWTEMDYIFYLCVPFGKTVTAILVAEREG